MNKLILRHFFLLEQTLEFKTTTRFRPKLQAKLIKSNERITTRGPDATIERNECQIPT